MNKTYKKKLIEVAIPLEAINAASAREKSIRHGHPSTLHLWWARRPLAACRAVLFSQLVDDPSEHVDKLLKNPQLRKAAEKELADRLAKRARDKEESKAIPADDKPVTLEDVIIELERQRLFKIIEDLVKWENSTNREVLDRARAEILRSCDGELPSVYDPFSGGGSIPLEAQRLGLPAYGSDLNPVAVMIGKAMIELPAHFKDMKPVHPGTKNSLSYNGAEGLAEDILYYAERLKQKAWQKIGHLYPKVQLSKRDGGGEATVLAWLWARTVASPNPAVKGARIPLISNYWLCNKPKRKFWLEPRIEGTKISFEVHHGNPSDEDAISAGTKSARGANFTCLLTGDAVTADYVKAEGMAGRMGWQLVAIVAEGKGGRRYVAANEEHEKIAFSEQPDWRPEYPLSQHPQYMSVTNYGPRNVSDLFMDRQTIALNAFINLIPEVTSEIPASKEYKKVTATYLALSASRLANRQSTSTFWHTSGEKVEQVFAMQALPMRWDTAEGNPFSSSSGNFIGQVEYLAKSVAALPTWGPSGHMEQRNAQVVDFANYVISTDPPYYDNVPYADLSDFFYVWLRRSLAKDYPELFQTVLVPKAEELVADHQRHKGRDAADAFFLDGMTNVMRHMAEQGRRDVPAAIYYAFRQGEVEEGGTSSKGWATFLQSVISAGYRVDATWPVRTELVGNLKKNRNALATSVVLSCRKRPESAEVVTRSEFMRALKREIPIAITEMQRANIAPVDIPQASIGPGIGIFSRYKAVLESDDSPMSIKAALQIINQELDEFLSEQEGEFDADTRFALHWFGQNGFERGQFGDADNLARARGISVESVKHAGIVESAAGKVRILKRDELSDIWDPATDAHLTVWECCQHLIRTLEREGEHEAAVLLKKIGPDRADAVKDLAYCLYDVCSNKRKDAKEGTSYNALIAVWTELTRQAASIHEIDLGGDRQTAMNL
jgi:putative DNA methylase